MIVKPKTRGFICTTAHPAGCDKNVQEQIASVKAKPQINGAKHVLVIGCSTGFGLSSRIASAFGCGAKTLGIAFDKAPDGKRTGSAGWYNCAAFEKYAYQEGLYAKTLIGDAFSQDMKQRAIACIKEDLGKIDMLVYSVAAPKRTDHEGVTHSSVLKPVGQSFDSKTIDLNTNQVTKVSIDPASQEEVDATVKVMGGEDWQLWIDALQDAGLLDQNFLTVAYSYIGPELTHPIYKNGSIGQAKAHLKQTADHITEQLAGIQGKAYISVNKALVTQASSAIPVVPLYISILFKVMKEKGLHEGCMEQMHRLYQDRLFADSIAVDQDNCIRMDDWEMREDVQKEVMAAWDIIHDENLSGLSDLEGYWDEFFRLFGFRVDGVDYDQDVDIMVELPSAK